MRLKVFLLGRPGSGKSTVAQFFEAIAQKNGWDTFHLYDYQFLQRRFQWEQDYNVPEEQRTFCPRGPEACHGFDVCANKFGVLDAVLEEMGKEVQSEVLCHTEDNKLILIEFARKDYSRALHTFSEDVLPNAYLLYIKLGLEVCIKRVQKRTDEEKERSEYDHFVSEEIMRGYYGEDDWSSEEFSQYLDYLQRDGVKVATLELENDGDKRELEDKVEALFASLRRPEYVLSLSREPVTAF